MRFALFYHSLISDWNHGNAHFLRGVCCELLARGHSVQVFERANGWSLRNLREEYGEAPLREFHDAYPQLHARLYEPEDLDLDNALNDTDFVIVHEWNDPRLIARLGRHRASARYRLLFHDTHHRAISAPHELMVYDLSGYDGVLAFGEVLRRIYLDRRWAVRAWTWHEAADTRVFRPPDEAQEASWDLIWVGNWGDDERTCELREFLIEPARALSLRTRIYGVRYPPEALAELARAGLEHAGWTANFKVPGLFSKARATVHVPRRFYREHLPGIPTIRVFEALACGIPLVSAPWQDSEGLFEPGRDYLVARDGAQMRAHLEDLCTDRAYALSVARQGLDTIRARHTCAHRVQQLLSVCDELLAET